MKQLVLTLDDILSGGRMGAAIEEQLRDQSIFITGGGVGPEDVDCITMKFTRYPLGFVIFFVVIQPPSPLNRS